MRKMGYVILLTLPLSTHAQIELSRDVLKAAEMVAIGEDDIPGVLNINYNLKPKEECAPEVKKELAGPVDKEHSKVKIRNPFEKKGNEDNEGWRFSVRTTLTGPTKALEKSFTAKTQNTEVKSALDKIIQTDYKSYEDRMKAVGDACKGMNEMDKINMGSQLASRLSAIYDNSRADGGSDAVVKTEDLWKSLKANKANGVCRDASIAVSQLLLACGFKKDQLSIKSYRTEGGGHQVTSILTKDGEFTINWGELYEHTDANGRPLAPDPNIVNTGLFYGVYDPETGKLIEQKRTDYADALKIVAGGKPIDPTYTPNMMLAEAAMGGLSAKIFKLETDRGDSAKGVGLSYNEHDGNDRSFIDLAVGGAFSMSSRDILTRRDNTEELNQKVIYFQSQIKAQKALPLFETKDGKVSLAPALNYNVDMMMAKNDFRDRNTTSVDVMTEVGTGATVYYDSDPVKAHITGTVNAAATPRLYNTENGKSQYGIVANRYNLEAGLSLEGERYVTTANADVIISRYEKQTIVGAEMIDKKNESSCEVAYSVFDRTYGTREDYIVSRCQKNYSISRVASGTVDVGLKKPLNTRGVAASVGTTLKFK